MKAIVTDARYRMSLAVTRSLGRAGIEVACQEERGIPSLDALSFHSRYASHRVLTASPRRDPDAFIDDLLAAAGEGDVLIPMSLAAILAAAERIDRVRFRLRVALAPLESILVANDTQRLLEIAGRVGVPAPQTAVLPPDADPARLLDQFQFPVVIKYRQGEALALPPEQRYAIVRDPARFLDVYRAMSVRQASPLVQEYIAGDGWGMAAIFNQKSEPVAVFGHRRLREYPVTGGPSCFAESVRDERMFDYGLRLLKELRWQGVAMVEFKREHGTGEFKLMEINPRFWGSMPLAVQAGADFPRILYRVAAGEDVPLQTAYREGVRMRYLFQDLLSARGYLKRLPAQARGRFLRGFIGNLLDPRVRDGVFSLADPVPGLYYTVRAVRDLTAGRRRGSHRGTGMGGEA